MQVRWAVRLEWQFLLLLARLLKYTWAFASWQPSMKADLHRTHIWVPPLLCYRCLAHLSVKMWFFPNAFLHATYIFLKDLVDIKMCIFTIFLAGFDAPYTSLIFTVLLWVAFNSWPSCIHFSSAEATDMNYHAQKFYLLWKQVLLHSSAIASDLQN